MLNPIAAVAEAALFRRRRIWSSIVVATLILIGGHPALWADEITPVRIGFSAGVLGDVNENDAMAAVRVWAQALAQERGIPADPQPKILRGLPEIATALSNRAVECVNMTTEEYAALRGRFGLETLIVAVKRNVITEEYVLLVHRSNPIQRLADLRGRKLGMLHSSRASLAPKWLDTVLAREELGRAADFFGQIESAAKITKVVLPVFFHQFDACVVTRSGFDTMIELNPQTGQQLRVLAASQAMVPEEFCFRSDYNSPLRAKLLTEITQWHTSPAGRQILTLFQSDSLQERPFSCLDTALELLTLHERLVNGAKATTSAAGALEPGRPAVAPR